MAKGGSGGGMLGAVVAAIIFAVGFFIAFVVFVAKANRLQTELTQAHADAQEIVTPGERNADATRVLVDEAKRERKSLVGHLSGSMRETMRRVSGNERETAKSLGEKLDKIPGADTSALLRVVASRDEEIASATKQAEDAKAAAAAAQADMQAEADRVAKLISDQQATIAALQEEIGKYRAEVEQYRTNTGQTIAQNNQRVEDIRRVAADDKATSEDRLSKLRQENLILAGQLDEIRGKASASRLRANDPAALADGRVVSVSAAEGAVFIDLRRADRLVLGMSFEVYDSAAAIRPDEKGDYPRGKATLEVIRIGDDTSTARIVRQAKGNPIVTGDVVANAVYDPKKTYTFVVQGDFDLNRDGVSSSSERDEVAAIISNWGGSVIPDLTGSTDFLVLGDRPKLPPAPPPDAPIVVINEYIRLQRSALEYDRLFETARQTGVPILNQSRLYTLTGLR